MNRDVINLFILLVWVAAWTACTGGTRGTGDCPAPIQVDAAVTIDAPSTEAPSPMACHDIRDGHHVPELRAEGSDEGRWLLTVPAGRCLAAICVLPHEDEATLVNAPRLLKSDGREVVLTQSRDDEGAGLNEYCAQWDSLRFHGELGAELEHELLLTGRVYRPEVIIRY